MKCPLVKGQEYTFDYTLAIPKLLPNIKAVVKAQLVGEHGVLACVMVDGEVKE